MCIKNNKMKKLTYILTILLFSSCYTIKTARKDVAKANLKFPEITSTFCAFTFPVKEKTEIKTEFIKGETITQIDTLTIDCDSVVADTKKENKVKIKYQNIFRTDTIYKEVTKEIENTAKTKSLNFKIKRLENTNSVNELKIKTLRKRNNILIASLLGIIAFSFIKNRFF